MSPVVESQGGPQPGQFQRPKPVKRVKGGYLAPVDEVLGAIRLVVPKADWDRLRVAAWERWLELVTEQPRVNPGPEARRQAWWANQPDPGQCEPRHVAACWPPESARFHDGIVGQVLASRWCRPDGYSGRWNAKPRIVQLAREGLVEVREFKRSDPQAAKSIAGPLKHYCGLLREARDCPESRLIVQS